MKIHIARILVFTGLFAIQNFAIASTASLKNCNVSFIEAKLKKVIFEDVKTEIPEANLNTLSVSLKKVYLPMPLVQREKIRDGGYVERILTGYFYVDAQVSNYEGQNLELLTSDGGRDLHGRWDGSYTLTALRMEIWLENYDEQDIVVDNSSICKAEIVTSGNGWYLDARNPSLSPLRLPYKYTQFYPVIYSSLSEDISFDPNEPPQTGF